jgi:hypothetical protein
MYIKLKIFDKNGREKIYKIRELIERANEFEKIATKEVIRRANELQNT